MALILPATLSDLDALVALEHELFTSDRIPRRQFRYLLTRANSVAVKIEQEGKLAGYLILLRRRRSQNLRIYSIGISTWARHLGYGRELVSFAEQFARENTLRYVTLEVCEQNIGAIKLYERTGFQRHGEKPGYYEDGCNALCMRKEIFPKDTAQ
ncbi:GNAT family N-acetyltransferase [Desulfopila aestuarii]|uniref:Ribosomal protein S18 acetylase RimI n=1 Tax=Desulfopila aestuarii DSM 18488 TaxID=1121416 RepID=A0A1M7Y8U4_9BACT|nr:N-acetyltransferase [Desulfopila aestuarii]SHO48948.1 Ribosomal protein S18 acetylase RimI [Desulfopila aestuarii DSM 18488]